jgi:hypothetical protein
VVTVTKPLLTGEAAEHIERLWPEHAKHLSPPGNTMGRGTIDPEEGVVCNCGEVLGYPTVQDEADYVMAEAEQPDTSGAQSGEPEHEPDYQDPDMLEDLKASGTPGGEATADEAQSGPPYAVGESVTVAGMDFTKHSESPFPEHNAPPWDTSGDYHEDTAAERRALANEPPSPPKGVMPYRDPGVVPAEDPLAARVVVIDPSQPYTPLDVERQLLDIEARLERGMHAQRYWEEREFYAESGWTQKAARVRLEDTSGAKDIRDARVQVRCAEEWRELLLCRSMVRAMRETMHTLRSLQTGYQSVLRSAMDSMRQPVTSRRTP